MKNSSNVEENADADIEYLLENLQNIFADRILSADANRIVFRTVFGACFSTFFRPKIKDAKGTLRGPSFQKQSFAMF